MISDDSLTPFEATEATEATLPDLDFLTSAYPGFAGATWRVVIGRGALMASFGPYSGPEASAVVLQCIDEGVPAFLRAECSTEFDWDLARDLRDAIKMSSEAAPCDPSTKS